MTTKFLVVNEGQKTSKHLQSVTYLKTSPENLAIKLVKTNKNKQRIYFARYVCGMMEWLQEINKEKDDKKD